MIKEAIEKDIKTAMLAGDKVLVTTLRGLKSAILYAEVATGDRDKGLPEATVIDLLAKEAKKRQESADLYTQGNNSEKAAAELTEKAVIQHYLPAQLDDTALREIIDTVIAEQGATGQQAMGQVIASVKQKTAGTADGGRIAALVKSRLVV